MSVCQFLSLFDALEGAAVGRVPGARPTTKDSSPETMRLPGLARDSTKGYMRR